jgi:hypothetical protein
MHDEQDFIAAHGCSTVEEYDRKRFFEWVDAMEDNVAAAQRMAVTRQRTHGILIQPIESIVRVKTKQVKQQQLRSASQ